MKISVVIPTYNCMDRKYDNQICLVQSLKSISEQTMNKNDFEVIFVDDCSKDQTVSFIQQNEYIDNFYVIQNPNNSGGASVPRNIGLLNAKGEYVFFMDSDDYLSPSALENMYEFAKENDSDIVIPKFVGVGRTAAKKIFEKGNVGRADVIKNHLISTMSVFRLYKKEFLLKNHLIFPEDFDQYEDFYFNINAYTKVPRVGILADQTYYHWVMTDGENLSQKKINFPKYLEYHKSILQLIKNESDFPIKVRYIARMLQLWTIKQIYKHYNNLEDEIIANYQHKLFREFVENYIKTETIEFLPKDDSLFLQSVMNYDRYKVSQIREAINYSGKSYIRKRGWKRFESYEEEVLENYWLHKKYGDFNFQIVYLDVDNTRVELRGDVYSGLGRTFSNYNLVLRSRSSGGEGYVISNDTPSFEIDVVDLFKFNKGYWDMFIEVEHGDIILGCMVPMPEHSNGSASQDFELYKNWVGGLTIRNKG